VADADTFFGQELPAVQRCPFGEADAARVTQPVLAVLGGASPRAMAEALAGFFARHPLRGP
jgi:hypothetical protein